MKKTLFLCAGILFYATIMAQTNYTMKYVANAGNPNSANTDDDDVVFGWTPLIGASISTNQWSPSTALPFTFNYFGNPVTNFKVSANGLVTFSTTTTLPNNNVALPSSGLTDSTIACFWDAFTTVPPTSSNDFVVWKVWGTAPNRQLWIKWASYEIGAPKVADASFMCMLEEGTDKIYLVEGGFATNMATLASTTTAGIQLNSTTGLMYGSPNRPRVANGNSPTDNNVLTFSPYTLTNMSLTDITASQPNLNNIPKNGINEAIMRIDVNMAGELSPQNLTEIALNTSGTTSDADITNARVFYSGNDSNYSTATQFGSAITSPSGAFIVSGAQPLKMGRNYFWVAYSVSNSAATNNIIDITCATATIGGTPYTPLVSAPVGSRTIKAALSGTVNVGTGNTYVYLSDVFKEITANGLSGNTILSITSDINDTAVASLTYGGNYTIKIVPSAEVLRNFTVSFPTTYIDLSGAKNVTFEGKGPVSGTGKYLRFINKDLFGSTFSFTNGSCFDTISSCIIEGAISSQTRGMIHLGASSAARTGVRDIHILNNDIRDRSDSTGLPIIAIYSAGTTSLTNGNITISNNNIFNYRRSAVYIESGNVNDGSFTISNNHMYCNSLAAITSSDLVSIAFLAGPLSNNNMISGNYIGGQAPFCAGSAWSTSNNVNWIGMTINSAGSIVQNNTIQNIEILSTLYNIAFIGIRMDQGALNNITVNNNTIGHSTNPNSIINNTGFTYGIYSLYGAGAFNITNNTVANIRGASLSNQASTRGICIQAGGAVPTISGNIIHNLTADGIASGPQNPTSYILHGIGVVSSAEASPTIIRNNTIYNLVTTSITVSTHPAGIVIDQATENGIIEGNTIYGIENPTTGSTASIHGLYIQTGTKNWIVRNNMISITNGTNTNDIIIKGISDNHANNTNKYYNNTIYIGGSIASGISNSYAFERRLASAANIRNNIFYNERTGGTGVHAAIANVASAPATNWDANTSGYNLLIAENPASVGFWGTSPQTFAQWQSTSAGDKTSWSEVSTTVTSANFFKGIATGNLSLDTSNALCWYALGKGIALTGNNFDIHGDARSVSIITDPVDLGADEIPIDNIQRGFSLVAPPNAVVSGNIINGDSSIFTFAGRTIAKVYWNAGAPPSSINMRYYTGIYPLYGGPLGGGAGSRFNSYYDFSSSGAGIFDASVKLFYDSALFGNIINSTSIRMVAGVAFTPSILTYWDNYYPSTLVDTAERSFRVNNLTSVNRFTGTQLTDPLDVKLTRFNGTVKNEDANLYWQSASELNVQSYKIERSYDGKQFKTTGSVKALNKASKYEFVDFGALGNNTLAYYRLKMVDNDGSFEYSNIIALQLNQNQSLDATVYPNPYTSVSSLSFTSEREQDVSVVIRDIQGRIISAKQITTQIGINSIPIDLQQERNGIYFIHLTTNGESFQTKIIK